MRWPDWISNALRTPAPKRKRRRLSNAERRKRDEQFIPLQVGRLEDRRVLSGSALSITPGKAHAPTNDTTPIKPFSVSPKLTISDTSASPPPLTVTVKLVDSSGAAVGHANGILTDANAATDAFTETSPGSGEYTFTDSYANINNDLQGLDFTPTVTSGNPGNVTTTVFQVTVSDGTNSPTDNSTSVDVTELNVSPTLNGANNLAPIPANANPNPGVPVSDLISGQITDPDSPPNTVGIAVDGVTGAGQWEYSTGKDANGSSIWHNINSTASDANAVLLDPTDLVRFVPNTNVSGSATISFRAWDGSNGASAGTTADASTNGDPTAFSSATATATLQVLAPPTISGSGALVTSDSAAVDPFDVAATPLTITDTNIPAPVYNVTLSFSTANGDFSSTSLTTNGWSGSGGTYTLTGVTAAAAQTDLQNLEFDLNGMQLASPYNTTDFTVSLASSGQTVATTTAGEFSVTTKDAPTLTASNSLSPVFENDLSTNPMGTSVAALISGDATDYSGIPPGIAVTSVDNTTNGTWEYSGDPTDPTSWAPIGSVSETSALLLVSTDYVRFVPNSGFSSVASPGATAVTPAITFQAWDGTGGYVAGDTPDVSTGGTGTSPFSSPATDQSSSVFVDGLATISGTSSTPVLISDHATGTKPFSGVTIGQTSDPNNSPPTVTVCVTLLDSDGTTDAGDANGTLSNLSGFTKSSPGVYTYTDTAANVTTALDALVFTPTGAKTTIFEITADNGHATPATDSNTTINALASPTVTGAVSQNTDDGVPITPFSGGGHVVTIGDTSQNPPSLTVTITLTNDTNAAAGNLDGLSDPNAATDGFTESSAGSGVYTFTDSFANINNDLQGLIFTSVVTTGHRNRVTTTSFEVSVSDGVNLAVTDATAAVVHVKELNIAPTLNGANNLPAIPASADPDSGVAVSTLISGQVTDPEVGQTIGIAVTGVDDTNGFWEYSLDGGSSWTYFINPTGSNPDHSLLASSTHTTTNAAPSQTKALVLLPTDLVRFVPKPGFSGSPNPAITFRAWDGSDNATHGTTDDASHNGGSTAFSAAEQQSTVAVLAPPTFSGSAALVTSDSAAVDPFNVSGTPLSIADANSPAPVYDVTLSLSTTANGNFSAASLTAGGWTGSGSTFKLTGVTAAQAQAALEGLEFDPNGTQQSPPASTTNFTVSLAYDTPQTSDTQTVATTTAGSFSVTIKDAPTLTGSANFTPVFENDLNINGHDTGMSVAALIAGNATDHSGIATGIAVTAVDDTNGAWEYSLNSGTTWFYIGTPPVSDPTGTTQAYPNGSLSATAALLLPSTALVRFVPNNGFSGLVTGGITFQAWDGTGGTAGGTADATQNGGATAFSTASQSPSVFVDGLATINGAATTPFSITDETTGTTPLSGVQIGQTSDPSNAAPDVTVSVLLFNSDSGVLTAAGDANGTLSTTSGFTETAAGLYTFTGTAAAAQTALEALVFTPTAHQVAPGSSVSTVLVVSASNQHAAPATDSNTTINAAAVHDPPTMTIVNSATGHPVTYILPAASMGNALDGTTIGTISGKELDKFDANNPPVISFQITGTDAAAFAIASVQPGAGGTYTAVLKVVDSSALAYSTTPIVLTITATDDITAPLVGALHAQNLTVDLWQVSASATPIGATSSTTVTVGLQDPQPDVFRGVVVNFDDGHTASPNSPIAPGTFSFNHFFTSNPGPTAASPIPITVTVTDTQGHTAVIQTIATVDGTGITGAIVIQQTTSAAVLFTPAIVLTPVAQQVAVDASTGQQGDTGVAPSEVTAGEGRQVTLRIVAANGVEGDDIRVLDAALNDLPGMLKKLPDGHYRVFLSEDGRTRLMMDVVVRGGRPSDPSQESSGGEDRPPSSQIEYHPPALVANKVIAGKQSLPVPGGATNSTDGAKDLPKADLPLPTTPQPTPATVSPASGPKTGDGAELRRHGHSGENQVALELATAGVGLAAVGLESRPQEIDRVMARLGKRSLSKAARLGRRLRGAVGRLPK